MESIKGSAIQAILGCAYNVITIFTYNDGGIEEYGVLQIIMHNNLEMESTTKTQLN